MKRLDALRTAARVAPLVREAWTSSSATAKRIRTVDSSGRVVRVVSAVEIVEKQLLREGIEIGAPPGQRPKALRCECGMPYLVPKKGKIAVRCARCEADRWRCTGTLPNGDRCTRRLSSQTWAPNRILARHGRAPVCWSCSNKAFLAAMTPGQRRERIRKMHAAMTPEQRRENARKANAAFAALTPEQRRERTRSAVASRWTNREPPVAACATCGALQPGGAGWRKGLCQRCYMKEWSLAQKRKQKPCADCGKRTMLSRRGLCALCGDRRRADQHAQRRERARKAGKARRKNRDAKQGRATP
jgi:hypothetical protein